jgi:hypothetical protein
MKFRKTPDKIKTLYFIEFMKLFAYLILNISFLISIQSNFSLLNNIQSNFIVNS